MTAAPTALIVEDDPLILEFLGMAVADCGYRIVEAQDGMAAIDAMEEQGFALLVADYNLPGGISGEDIAGHFRSVCPGARIIVTSGDPMPTDLPAARFDFLQKPFTAAQLIALIAREPAFA